MPKILVETKYRPEVCRTCPPAEFGLEVVNKRVEIYDDGTEEVVCGSCTHKKGPCQNTVSEESELVTE